MDAGGSEQQHTPRLTSAILRYFWQFVRPDWKLLTLSFLGLNVQAAFSVLVAMVPAIIVRNWSMDLRDELYVALAGLLGINLFVLGVQTAVNFMMTTVTENVVRRVRYQIFKKIGILPSEEMSFQVVGKFAQRTTGDVMRLGGLVSPGLVMAMFSFLQLIFMLGALFWLDARFAWTLPVTVIIIWFSISKLNERARFGRAKINLLMKKC